MLSPARHHRPGLVGLATLAVAGGLLAGCGGGEGGSRAATSSAGSGPATTQALPPSHRGGGGLRSLDQVPQTPSGTADPADAKLATDWFDLVRKGEDAQAADLMTDGTRFVNGVVLRLRDQAMRVAAADSLPCGAIPVDVGSGAGGYVVLKLRLADKAGAAPCGGTGSPVGVAIHVDHTVDPPRIDDWVRLGGAVEEPADPGTPV